MSECPRCGCPDEVEITTFGEAAPRFICVACSMPWTEVRIHAAPSLGRMEGPSVPTPEDILRSAGVDI